MFSSDRYSKTLEEVEPKFFHRNTLRRNLFLTVVYTKHALWMYLSSFFVLNSSNLSWLVLIDINWLVTLLMVSPGFAMQSCLQMAMRTEFEAVIMQIIMLWEGEGEWAEQCEHCCYLLLAQRNRYTLIEQSPRNSAMTNTYIKSKKKCCANHDQFFFSQPCTLEHLTVLFSL